MVFVEYLPASMCTCSFPSSGLHRRSPIDGLANGGSTTPSTDGAPASGVGSVFPNASAQTSTAQLAAAGAVKNVVSRRFLSCAASTPSGIAASAFSSASGMPASRA